MTNLSSTVAGSPPRECWPIDSRYIVQSVSGAGSHFFDRESVRFFSSRVAGSGWQIGTGENGGEIQYVVVTSERFDLNTPRLYTVRLFTVGDHARWCHHHDDPRGFQGYRSAGGARRAAERWARELAARVA